MTMHYMNEADEANPSKLPNIETFEAIYGDCEECGDRIVAFMTLEPKSIMPCQTRECQEDEVRVKLDERGWYYWYCLPGCLPDTLPVGPFETEEDALEDARS